MEMGKLIIDIDGTICSQEKDYSYAEPNYKIIEKINKKYDEGYCIILFTARGSETGIDWKEMTKFQLQEWGVKYHELKFGKPAADLYIDDRVINVDNWEPSIDHIAKIDKPWGVEYLLYKTDQYAFKRLEIAPGKNISKQYHKKKHETWHVVEGKGEAAINDKYYELKPGVTIPIHPEVVHQAWAKTKLVIVEASTTELNDIVRL